MLPLALPIAFFNAVPIALATPTKVTFPSSTPVKFNTIFPIPFEIRVTNPVFNSAPAPSFHAIAPIRTVTVSISKLLKNSVAPEIISFPEIVFKNPMIVFLIPSTQTLSVSANEAKSKFLKNSLNPVAIDSPNS